MITGIENVSEESDRTYRTGLDIINNAKPKELEEAERRRGIIALISTERRNSVA